MSASKILIITAAIAIAPFTTASAQDSCGQATQAPEIGDSEKFCNIYDRNMAYREERNKFRKSLNERREDYVEPHLNAQEKYKKDIEALNKDRTIENDTSSL